MEIQADNGLGGGAAWEEFNEQELASTLLADDANREGALPQKPNRLASIRLKLGVKRKLGFANDPYAVARR